MLTALHLLLTYTCSTACDHCFLYCSPSARGTFTLAQVEALLAQAQELGTIEEICFEGGEPFLYYPLLLEGVRQTRERGFRASLLTNGYWATTEADAEVWLRPLADLGVASVGVSDDELHGSDEGAGPGQIITAAAARLGLSAYVLTKSPPAVAVCAEDSHTPGEPEITGGIRFRGRAAEKLVAGLPTRPAESLTQCPHEDLRAPRRVHVDCLGRVHICQGLNLGNCWETPLAELVAAYDPEAHPITGPLLRGGPLALAREHGQEPLPGYVDECHLCYLTRRALLERYPRCLGPRQVYGLPATDCE
jgi:hypothetical protein